MTDEITNTKADKIKKRQQLDKRWTALRSEQSTFRSTWSQIDRYIAPGRYREYRSDVNKGDRKDGEIINFTAREAHRALGNGMQTGITNPARPWFNLRLPGIAVQLGEDASTREWIDTVVSIMRERMAQSNTYNGFHSCYLDLGAFCVAALLVESDEEDLIRVYSIPVGSFVLAASEKGRVDTFIRQISLTVKQLVRLFGVEKLSSNTARMYREGNLDQRIDVLHAIYPNDDFVDGGFGTQGKRWSSDWWEQAKNEDGHTFLRESGYFEFPVMAPAWERTGEDVYGRGPGWDALGDAKAIQKLERRKAQAVDKIVNPPMVSPVAAMNQNFNFTAGGMNFADSQGAGSAIRPAIEIHPSAITIIQEIINEHADRVKRAFHANLWLLMMSDDQPNMTATEVSARNEEKLQQLGAVLEGLHDHLLRPFIDRVFNALNRAGLFPPPPEQIQGLPLNPEYISIMAQAQKALGTTGISRLAQYVGNVAQASQNPAVFDKLNLDAMTEKMGDFLGTPSNAIRSDDEVSQIRGQRAAEMQKQQMQQQAVAAAGAAKDLAQSPVNEDNGLNEVLRSIGAR